MADLFDGITYQPDRDNPRLVPQIVRVWNFMNDDRWHTISMIAESCHGTEAAVSARLRDLRKERFGAHTVEREYVCHGLWRYRLIPNREHPHLVIRPKRKPDPAIYF